MTAIDRMPDADLATNASPASTATSPSSADTVRRTHHHTRKPCNPRKPTRFAGAGSFIVGNVLLGTIVVFLHEADAPALTATWFRCAFGLLSVTVWLVWRREAHRILLPRHILPVAIATGTLMVAGWILFFSAIPRMSAGVATVLFQMQSPCVAILGAWLFKVPIERRRLVAVLAAMTGLVLVTGIPEIVWSHWHGSGESKRSVGGHAYAMGVAFCLAGAFLNACVTLAAKRMGSLPAGVLAWWQCAIGTAALLVWPLTQGWPAWGVTWWWLSGLGLIHTGLVYSLIYAGVSRLSTDRIAALQFIYPAVAVTLDWIVYGHRLDGLQLLGLTAMAFAIAYGERTPQRRS